MLRGLEFLKNSDKRAKIICQLIMILVYSEKEHYGYDNFKVKLRDPEEMLRKIRLFTRPPIEWQ
jgi:hypothetical protein